MVKVTDVAVRKASGSERTFVVLMLSGGLEIVTSQATGKQYATIRKCSLPCTFEEPLARTLIGTELPGSIVRVPCEPYAYTSTSTGEVMMLNFTYGYQETPQSQSVGLTPAELV